MTNPFKRPYIEIETSKEKLVSILVFGLFIFLFLYLLKPVIINENWTLGKSILWNFFIASSIGAANYFYINLIFHQAFVLLYLFYSVWTAILVGSIPVTISYIIRINRIYKSALEKAAITPEEILWENEVIIRAGNPKNEFRCNPKIIIYLCSNDNYVTIVTVKGDVQNKTTIRGTLKSAETELRKNSRILRCHKCYIVNLDFVEKVTGHNQNMIIRLKPSGTEIPVSRLKADSIQKKIKP